MDYVKLRIYLLLSCLVILAACASNQVKGKPPFVGISSMIAKGDSLASTFDIHNINDVKLDIDGVDIEIRVQDTVLVHYASGFQRTIDPNTTEEASFEQAADSTARQLLTDLESGSVSSLPFSLDGRVHTPSDGYLSFKNEGHLYPVPGRPGQFRSASARARERR